MAAEILSHRTAASEAELDAEADALGRILSARVTFVAAGRPGRRRFRSDADAAAGRSRTTATRPEIVEARQDGVRHRAAPQRHDRHRHDVRGDSGAQSRHAAPGVRAPRAAADRRRSPARRRCGRWRALGFAAGLAVAIALTWVFSAPLARRLRAIDERARRYADAATSRGPLPDYGDDEIGTSRACSTR